MKTAIDSNVLFDLLTNDPHFAPISRRALTVSAQAGSLSICSVVYAELATRFVIVPSDLDTFLTDLGVSLDQFEPDALRAGAAAWHVYMRTRGQRAQCPRCGQPFVVTCPNCQSVLGWRQHILPDFLIGGHALHQADTLLTRDPGTYRTYLPRLSLTVPAP